MDNAENLPKHEGFHLLRGRVQIRQGRDSLRAGTDAVLLGAFPLEMNRVLELGCGVGQALLCYAVRFPVVEYLVGIEREGDQALLAYANVQDNGLGKKMRIITGDFCDKPMMQNSGIYSDSFDLVLMNPPYFAEANFTAPEKMARQATHIEDTPLAEWIAHGLRYCTQFGWLAMIHRPERLVEILSGLSAKAGNIHLLPVHSRDGQPAKRIMVFAQKSRNSGLKILPPLVMHEGEDFSVAAKRVLDDAYGLAITLAKS